MNTPTPDPRRRHRKRARTPRCGLVSLVSIGAAAAFAVGPTGVPVGAEEPAPRTLRVDIDDTAGVLSEADRRLLESQAGQLHFPPEVNALRFVVLKEDMRDINRYIEVYAAENHPDWIDGEIWADGQIVLAVGYTVKQYGVFCGYDTCQSVNLDDYGRRDTVLKVLSAPFKASRYAEGLYQGARELAEPGHSATAAPSMSRRMQMLAVAGIVVGSGVLAAAAWAARRRGL